MDAPGSTPTSLTTDYTASRHPKPFYCALLGVITFVAITAIKSGMQVSNNPSVEAYRYQTLAPIIAITTIVWLILRRRRSNFNNPL